MRKTSPHRCRARVALLALCASLACAAVAAEGRFTLISPDEHAEALADPAPEDEGLRPKGAPGAPGIVVRAPDTASGSIASPVDIELGFEAEGDATIDMDTLRIYYVLLFKKDVTARILEHADVGPDFIRAEGAELPAGNHAFVVEIGDSAGRTSRERFEITVEG